LGLDYDSDDEEGDEADPPSAVPPAGLAIPALAQGLVDADEDSDDSDAQPQAPSDEEEEADDEDGGGLVLPSVDDALDQADLDPEFLRRDNDGPSYGSALDTTEAEAEAAMATAAAVAAARAAPSEQRGGGSRADDAIPEKKAENTRQKNARKEKLGQATFTLKWDRDCGAEKASDGLKSSATLESRTQAGRGANAAGGKGGKGGKGDAVSVKDRTKEKRKRDQSASFLGGRWKTEEEMHMRDHFDS